MNSLHRSKLVFWRVDTKQEEVFDFAKPSTSPYPVSSDIHFDGKMLTCKEIEGAQEECNGLPLNEPIPVVLLSLQISPRDAEFYGETDENKWSRNRYSLHGSNYGVKCKGNHLLNINILIEIFHHIDLNIRLRS